MSCGWNAIRKSVSHLAWMRHFVEMRYRLVCLKLVFFLPNHCYGYNREIYNLVTSTFHISAAFGVFMMWLPLVLRAPLLQRNSAKLLRLISLNCYFPKCWIMLLLKRQNVLSFRHLDSKIGMQILQVLSLYNIPITLFFNNMRAVPYSRR